MAGENTGAAAPGLGLLLSPAPGDGDKDYEARLRALVSEFDEEGRESRRLIRAMADENWGRFYSAALEVLKRPPEGRGVRFLVALFNGRGLLLSALGDPALTCEQSVAVARVALQVDSMFDVNLANYLADSEPAQSPARIKQLVRLVEVVGQISSGGRILSCLRRMVRHPNPYLRSKAVLLIGRFDPTLSWLNKRLAEQDPRIRANAVESLWQVDTGYARGLLEAAAQDGDNRVAGNALLALYRKGEASAAGEIARMSEHESAAFRATAAWAMGETGDAGFSERLARMLGDTDAAVRRRAFQSIRRLKQLRAAAQRP